MRTIASIALALIAFFAAWAWLVILTGKMVG